MKKEHEQRVVGPPKHPETFEQCYQGAMHSINELKKSSMTAEDKSALDNLEDLANLANSLLSSFKNAWNSTLGLFPVKNGPSLLQIKTSFAKFDPDTWAPKVSSVVQANIAEIYSTFIRDIRGVLRDKNQKELDPTKVAFVKKNDIEPTLMKMADAASDNRSKFKSENPELFKPAAGPVQAWVRPKRETAEAAEEKKETPRPK